MLCSSSLCPRLSANQNSTFFWECAHQGSQFTSSAFTAKLEQRKIQISMDGRGRAFDNIFVERLWRSVKYEEVYLKNYAQVRDAWQGLKSYFKHYNETRVHQGLDYNTPAEVYFKKGLRSQ